MPVTRVIKRDGREVDFEPKKIFDAIYSAANSVKDSDDESFKSIYEIHEAVLNKLNSFNRALNVEEIQDIVEEKLLESKDFDTATAYIRYRHEHKLNRENQLIAKIMSIVDYNNESVKQENSNKNPEIIPTQRDYIAGEISKDITFSQLLPKEVVDAHEKGIIHFHDADYFVQHSHNCCLVNLEDMLQNGTVISKTYIDKPHMFSTACNIATQIIAQVASSQYGGQTISVAHLSPFVGETRRYLKDKFPNLSKADLERIVMDDVSRGIQTLQYQILTLMTTNGQTPFVTIYLDINEIDEEGREKDDLALVIEEVLYQRIKGVKNETGQWITPAFPKLIYALDHNNMEKNSKYYYLTELAAECTARRMVPDYISRKVERELKYGDNYPCMGCRSFLTPDRTSRNYAKTLNYDSTKSKYYGRFNQGVVTINLVDVALSSGGDLKAFWDILYHRLNYICYPALMARHERLKGTLSDVAPILWQHGALARLEQGESIDELLYHGYSTLSLGYAGLYECTKYMTGKSHTSEEGKEFAIEVMKILNEWCTVKKRETDIDFSLYGTPIESTTYKFASCLQKRFGIIPGVTDRNYITNSYHVHVTEQIDAFTKLKFESEFQALSPGGAISYVEVPNMTNNIEAVLAVIRYIFDNIMYAELNTKLDYCQKCGYEGEIKIVEDEKTKKLVWECPKCGCRDQNKMNVARRTCGYIGTNYWNQGRTQEIAERVLHL